MNEQTTSNLKRIRPEKPRRYFVPDGRPAEQCEECNGSGDGPDLVQRGPRSVNPPGTYPSGKCSVCHGEGVVLATGLRAAVLLLEDALNSGNSPAAKSRILAAKAQIEDIACEACAADKTAPEAWR